MFKIAPHAEVMVLFFFFFSFFFKNPSKRGSIDFKTGVKLSKQPTVLMNGCRGCSENVFLYQYGYVLQVRPFCLKFNKMLYIEHSLYFILSTVLGDCEFDMVIFFILF